MKRKATATAENIQSKIARVSSSCKKNLVAMVSDVSVSRRKANFFNNTYLKKIEHNANITAKLEGKGPGIKTCLDAYSSAQNAIDTLNKKHSSLMCDKITLKVFNPDTDDLSYREFLYQSKKALEGNIEKIQKEIDSITDDGDSKKRALKEAEKILKEAQEKFEAELNKGDSYIEQCNESFNNWAEEVIHESLEDGIRLEDWTKTPAEDPKLKLIMEVLKFKDAFFGLQKNLGNEDSNDSLDIHGTPPGDNAAIHMRRDPSPGG